VRKLASAIIGLAMMTGMSIVSFAQTTTNSGTRSPHINHRERRQQRRIAEGIESGQLTARETARLERQEARIRAQERRDKADGNFTAQERRQINRELNRESKRIYRQKHDAQHY
jgi:hypothetical protein